MKTRILVSIVLFGEVILLCACFSAGDGLSNYQATADGARWGWKEELSNPVGCLRLCGDTYDITLTSKKANRDHLTITVLSDNRPVFTWEGHEHSVFRVLENRLYYAAFHTCGSGGDIVAVDLKTGKESWRSELNALGPIAHSSYRNVMNLDANYEVVTVIGNESNGRYIEIKSASTGKTVRHKIFSKE